MKRVVTYVVPMAEPSADAGPARDEIVSSPTEILRVDPAQLPGGATRVEIVVTDEQASRILAAVLEHGSGNGKPAGAPASLDAAATLEVMLRKEMENAEPGAGNLLERIVSRVERQLISQVYSECDHVKSRAAARLGINRNTLLKKLRQFGEISEEESVEIAEPTERMD
jgi:DNA-binding protein Fis